MEIAKYATYFLKANQYISSSVYDRTKLFHIDASLCAISALALKANASTILRDSALNFYSDFDKKPKNVRVAKLFGTDKFTNIEKVVAANIAATQDLNSNGFSLGYSFDEPERNNSGEIDFCSFYPVVIAAAHVNPKIDGKKALKAMIMLDEIRGRLKESLAISDYKLDHAIYGGISSTIVYGALLEATPNQIVDACSLLANYTPWRAIRSDAYELTDSSGCSEAFFVEKGILCMNRVLDGIKTNHSLAILPDDVKLTTCGKNFSIMNMNFRFGCHSALSSGAIYSLVNVLLENPQIFEEYDYSDIVSIRVRTFARAYEMLGKLPRTYNPNSRQTALYSIPYQIARMLSKTEYLKGGVKRTFQDYYSRLALGPLDFSKQAISDEFTRELMRKIDVINGRRAYNKHFPEGIPSNINIYFRDGKKFSSGMTKFP